MRFAPRPIPRINSRWCCAGWGSASTSLPPIGCLAPTINTRGHEGACREGSTRRGADAAEPARAGRGAPQRERSAGDDTSPIFSFAPETRFQDRLRFAAAALAIVFSIVLLAVQLGLFVSFERVGHGHGRACVRRSLDRVPLATSCFEDPWSLDRQDRTRILSVPRIADAVPLVIGFTRWPVPSL